MYLVPVEIRNSAINGKGVFATTAISKDTVVWMFSKNHESRITKEDYARLDNSTKELYDKIAYLSPTSGMWVIPPIGDPARYTNHSHDPNTVVTINTKASDEPLFIASRDILVGEEITNDYSEYDENPKTSMIGWI